MWPQKCSLSTGRTSGSWPATGHLQNLEVNFLIAITVFAAFCLAQPTLSQSFPFFRLIHTLLGTLLVAHVRGSGRRLELFRGFANTQRSCSRSITSCGCAITQPGVYAVDANLTASQGLTALNGCIEGADSDTMRSLAATRLVEL
jgi:hypothetical protein